MSLQSSFKNEAGTRFVFSQSKYGDMAAFVRRLRNMGYEKVELIDTDEGLFMKKSEAAWMGLSGSALLIGKK